MQLSSNDSVSLAARALGCSGLLPFIGGALAVSVGPAAWHDAARRALIAYGAVIVSFLGGIHWGFALRQAAPPAALFAWGVVPSLVAWVGVTMPAYAGLVVNGVMLVVCYLVDRRVYPAQGAAAWLTLRFRLSAIASLSCFLAAAAT